MKIYLKKNKPGTIISTNIKIYSFDYIWNPKGEKIITKKHLELFLKEAFPRNFLFYWGAGFNQHTDAKSFTPSSYLWFLYAESLFHYNSRIIREDDNEEFTPYLLFLFDSREIYKKFAHLLSEEDFSYLLRLSLLSMEFYVDIWMDNCNDWIDCLFFSSKESMEKFLKENTEENKLLEDPIFWNKNLVYFLERIETNRSKIIDEKEIKRRPVTITYEDNYFRQEYDKVIEKIK